MNKSIYLLLALSSLVALSSCQREEPNKPVGSIEPTHYEGGRDAAFTDEELIFWESTERKDKSWTTARRGVNHRTSFGEASDNATQIEFMDATWYLSEGYAFNADVTPDGAEFVPMAPITTDIDSFVRTMKSSIEAGYVKRVLGFNPNNSRSLTAAEAFAYWAALEYLEVPLSSPVANICDLTWFKEFMALAAAEKVRMDYIAVEYEANIGDLGDGADLLDDMKLKLADFKSYMETSYPDYAELPVILTGVGTPDEDSGIYELAEMKERVKEFMVVALPWLEDATKCDYIEAYAWNTYNKNSIPASLYSKSGELQQMAYLLRDIDYDVDWELDIPEVEYENMLLDGGFDSGASVYSTYWSGNGVTYVTYSTDYSHLFMSGGGTGMILLNQAKGNNSKNVFQNNVMLKPNYEYAMGFTGRVHSAEGSASGDNPVSNDTYYVTINLRPSNNGGTSYVAGGQDLWANHDIGITSENDTKIYHKFNTINWGSYVEEETGEIRTRFIIAKLDNGSYCSYIDNAFLYEIGPVEVPEDDDTYNDEDIYEGNLISKNSDFESTAAWDKFNSSALVNRSNYITEDYKGFIAGDGMLHISGDNTGWANAFQDITVEAGKTYEFGMKCRMYHDDEASAGESYLTVNINGVGAGTNAYVGSADDYFYDSENGVYKAEYTAAASGVVRFIIVLKSTTSKNIGGAYVDSTYFIEKKN